MKPDLTYYKNSFLLLKNFLYFPEKKPGGISNPKPKVKKLYLKNLSYFYKKLFLKTFPIF